MCVSVVHRAYILLLSLNMQPGVNAVDPVVPFSINLLEFFAFFILHSSFVNNKLR